MASVNAAPLIRQPFYEFSNSLAHSLRTSRIAVGMLRAARDGDHTHTPTPIVTQLLKAKR